jgi:lipopolysaccharide biosynthesis glycosyltransferase
MSLRIFIGYDKNETVAYHVLAHSILARSSIPVAITPLNRANMRGFFYRERGEYDSTDFSVSRFLVPFLCGYDGFAVFMDCDMLVRGDVAELARYMTLMDSYNYAVRVVKHEYEVKDTTKFLGQTQTAYKRKNWSSVMIFNNRLCQKLTLEYVNKAHGLDLHQFKWCEDHQIAGMPKEWNWLVGEDGYESTGDPKLIHYTKGTPCFPDYAEQDFAELWRAEREAMLAHA